MGYCEGHYFRGVNPDLSLADLRMTHFAISLAR